MRDLEQMARSRATWRGNRSVYLATMVWLIWLLYLVPVTVSFLAAHPSPPRVIASAAGVMIFVAIYVWMAWQSARRLVGGASPLEAPAGPWLWMPVLVLLALSLILTNIDGKVWGALFIFTCAGAAGRLPARQAMGLLVAVGLITTYYGWRMRLATPEVISDVATIGFAGMTTILMVWAVTLNGRIRAEREDLARFAAVTEERLRIARDLHDLLGHNLSVIALKSELAGKLVRVSPERAATEIADIETVARKALQEVREAVAGYRQPALASELHGARELLAAAGIEWQYDSYDSLVSALPPAIEATFAWAVREGVTNVIRHSRARHCRLQITRGAASARIEITDDGRQADALLPAAGGKHQPGNGLRGLAERVEALGGQLEAGPDTGGGFRLAIRVPLASGEPDAGAARRGVEPTGGRAALMPVVWRDHPRGVSEERQA